MPSYFPKASILVTKENIFPKWVENKSKRKLSYDSRSKKYLGKLSFLSFFPQPLPLFPHLPLFAHLPLSASWWTVLAPLGTPTSTHFDSLKRWTWHVASFLRDERWTRPCQRCNSSYFGRWRDGDITSPCFAFWLGGIYWMYVCLYIHVCGVVQAQARTPCWKKENDSMGQQFPKTLPNSPLSKPSPSKQLQPTRKTICEFPSKDSQPQKKKHKKSLVFWPLPPVTPNLLDFSNADNQPGNHPHPNPPLPPTPLVLWSFPPVPPGHQSQTWRNLRVPGARGMMEWGDFWHFPRDDQMTNSNNGKNVERLIKGLGMGPRTTWEWLAMQQATRNNKWIERNTNGQEEGIFW